ncbi:MAG: hypothetical protein ACO1RT_01155 [Planctomycetaceae bacterium]
MKRIANSAIACCMIAASFMLSTGCSTLPAKGSLSKKMPWSKDKDKPEPYPNPVRMAVTWTPDTLVQTGRTPTRGFGGRLFFYDEKTKPVPVEGELTVHAFAESPTGEQGEVKRYHFTSEQFTKHFSQTDIGASYSVWIPWDAVGGDQLRVSLVPSFRAANGRLVQGEQALVGLPGKRQSVEALASTRPNAATLLQSARENAKSGLVTTTIPVRSSLMRETVPSLQQPAQPMVQAIAANTEPTLRTFDVAPLGLKIPSGGDATSNASHELTSATAPAAKPLRLGQGLGAAPTDGVITASATMPAE